MLGCLRVSVSFGKYLKWYSKIMGPLPALKGSVSNRNFSNVPIHSCIGGWTPNSPSARQLGASSHEVTLNSSGCREYANIGLNSGFFSILLHQFAVTRL